MNKETIQQNIGNVLTGTDFQDLGKKIVGKVRDVYVQDDKILLISSDRYSAFDRNLALVPFKGAILTQISTFWFEQTKDIIQNHIISVPDLNVVVAKKCSVIPIEVVVRGYITGVTGTALWTLYQKGERQFGDVTLPDGMHKNQKLEKVILTPTTKSDEHDEPIFSKEIISRGIVEEGLWHKIEDTAIKLFTRGQEIAEAHDLILVDTKYEFGLDAEGNLTLIDEIHTPDSSRYWQKKTYEARINEGKEPENFDKEFLRLWFKENCDPYKDEVLPKAPEEMIVTLSERYIQIYEQITGKEFLFDFNTPILDRIATNTKPYALKRD